VTEVQNFYDAGDFSEAIAEARASKSEYSDPQLHLLWGKSAEALGHLDEAMSAYERVIILDEDNVDVKVALADIYNRTKRDELALDTKKELQNYQLTPEQRSSLGLIKDKDIQRIKAQAKISIGYDDNINVSNDDEESTAFTRLNASLSYIDDLEDKKEWYLRSDLKVYYQNNVDAHNYDMLFSSIDLGVGYAGDGYNIYMPVGYGFVNYLDENLLDQISFEPRVDISLDDLILNINTKYVQRNYKPSMYKIMDERSYAVGAGAYYLSGIDFTYFNFKYEKFSADDAQSLFIDKDLLTFVLGVNYNISDILVTRLDYRYRLGLYDDEVVAKSEKREDSYNQIELKLSHFIDENMELYLSNRYAKNSSNNISTDYTKNISMFGLSVNY
jgi:opacity protein-like surface antigen